jgi:GNAT superfamily N-acetyltransferase
MIKLIEIQNEDFDGIYAEMEKNFIPDELRDYTHARRVLDFPEFHIYHVENEGEKVGFITLWCLDGVTFAEHFVIYEKFRGAGIGAKVLPLLQQKFSPLVLECEHPDTPMQARRLAFYKRNGFCENDYPYMQPAYRKDASEVPLVLMSYPAPLKNPAETAAHIRREVYEKAE